MALESLVQIDLDDEVEAPKKAISGIQHVEEQRVVENPISGVSWFSRKVKLGCQHTSAGTLNLEMEMTCSARIKRWHNRVEPPAPLGVGKLVSAQSKPILVVFAVFVRMPNLNKAAGKRSAAIVDDKPRHGYPFPTGRTGEEISIERRVRLEEWARFAFKGEIVPIVACTGKGQFRRDLRECAPVGSLKEW